METRNFIVGNMPAVDAALASLSITDPNPFRAARAPGARKLYDALKSAPISQAVATPEAMPVVTAPKDELLPIFKHLSNGHAAAGAAFPRGATFTDGRLDMCKQVVGPEYIGDLTQAVQRGGEATQVEHFLIGNNVVGNAGAADIARMVSNPSAPSLKTLYLAGNDFGVEGAADLSRALINNQSVRSLWLKRNPLGPDGAAALASMLSQNTSLKTLDMVNTGIMDEGAAALFEGLAENQTLRTLYLDANGLGPKAAEAMARYFHGLAKRQVVGLTGLFLSINRLSCEGSSMLAQSLQDYGQLKRLDIGANRIEETGLTATLEAATASPSFCYLGMGFYKSASDMGELPNWFGDRGAASIAEYITSTGGVAAIDVKDTHIGPDGLALLGDALENQPEVFELSAAQYNLKQQALFHRIERFLKRNVKAKYKMEQQSFRNGPLRFLKHGEHIDDIASIYRNVM